MSSPNGHDLLRTRCEMAIDGGTRSKLTAGMRLVARYKGEQHVAEVIEGDEGTLKYRLTDGREFKSPSAAGSALMAGIACNGWRFWSLEGAGLVTESTPVRNTAAGAAQTPHEGPAKVRPRCSRCGNQFVGPAQLAHHSANATRLCRAA